MTSTRTRPSPALTVTVTVPPGAPEPITDIASVQNQYSVMEHKHEDVLEYCTHEGLAFISWFPLDVGTLAQPDSPLSGIAAHVGATPTQIALAWLLARAENMVTIPGTSSIAHLGENVAAAAMRLTPEQVAKLNALAD